MFLILLNQVSRIYTIYCCSTRYFKHSLKLVSRRHDYSFEERNLLSLDDEARRSTRMYSKITESVYSSCRIFVGKIPCHLMVDNGNQLSNRSILFSNCRQVISQSVGTMIDYAKNKIQIYAY